jgi:peptidoglycan hydrolase-like protein with peptidoglycan-binding domain
MNARTIGHEGELRAAAPRPARAGEPRRRPRAIWRRLLTKERIILALVAAGVLAIAANATLFQRDRHPEPMFRPIAKAPPAVLPTPPQRQDVAQAVKGPPAPEPRAAASAPRAPAAATPAAQPEKPRLPVQPTAGEATEALLTEIQRELAKRGFFKGEPDGKPGPRMTQAIRDFQFAQRVAVDGRASETLLQDIRATKTTMKDELMDLVRRASTEEAPAKTVRDIQRALNKAGYGPLKEDGQWGPSTRTALNKFEADNRLPQKGEPRGANIRTLASVTGVQIGQ